MPGRGINKVILIGNLGADPEVRYMTNGDAVTNVRIATSETWKDKQTGDPREVTEWHRVVFFRRLAEIAGEYLRKGSKVYIEGSLKTRKWQGQDGQDRYSTEIIANEMQMLDSKSGGTTGMDGAPARNFAPSPGQAPASGPSKSSPDGPPPDAGGGPNDFDDDIPF